METLLLSGRAIGLLLIIALVEYFLLKQIFAEKLARAVSESPKEPTVEPVIPLDEHQALMRLYVDLLRRELSSILLRDEPAEFKRLYDEMRAWEEKTQEDSFAEQNANFAQLLKHIEAPSDLDILNKRHFAAISATTKNNPSIKNHYNILSQYLVFDNILNRRASEKIYNDYEYFYLNAYLKKRQQDADQTAAV